MLLHQTFLNTAARLREKVALVTDGGRHRYEALDRATAGLAAELQAGGVGNGDRVAVFAPNGLETVVGIYGALRAGAAFVPINPQTKADKLRYVLDDCRAKALVTHSSLAPIFTEALASARNAPLVVIGGDTPFPDVPGNRTVVPLASAIERPPMLRDPRLIDADLASIIYTSGSTGEPKGVMLTHLNMVTAASSIVDVEYLGLREDDVIACALPLAFDYGLYQVLMGFKVGATVLIEPSFTFPARVLDLMERERATVFPGVPTMFAMLLGSDLLTKHDLSSLRLITNTAAALSEAQIRELRRAFPSATLFSMYGLTECKRVSFLPPSELDRRPTSVGRGMPNEEVYLVDDQGRRLPNGSTGELVVRGSHVMLGYWEKPAETAERLMPGRYPGERALRTGDVFRTDEEGFLYFVGRKDDIIKTRGEKVSPREVENAIHELPAVADVAVVGVDDPLLGQAVKAYVVLRPGAACDERDVVRQCQTRLEPFMVPRQVEFVAVLPTTNTGKVSRRALRVRET